MPEKAAGVERWGMAGDRRTQTEPGGITYDRYRLDQIFARVVPRYRIRTALEMDAGGEKAMPSIYSIGLARAGCRVVLVNPAVQARTAWKRLGLDHAVCCVRTDPHQAGIAGGSVDLAWNFVSLSKARDFAGVLGEMARVSRRLVVTVHTNGYNLGYPWHRMIHWVFGFPWTHGDTRFSFPRVVAGAYRSAGLRVTRILPFDSPPWPDPPGFRDVRLHRQGIERTEDPSIAWKAPIIDYCAEERFPAWMRALSRLERLPVPRVVRYPVSHLFMVMAEVRP